jgi:hypothetical protein
MSTATSFNCMGRTFPWTFPRALRLGVFFEMGEW